MEIKKTLNNYFKKFEGIPSLIRLVSVKDVPAFSGNNTIIQQKLTVLATGAVSFVSMSKDKEIAESLNFDIDSNTAYDIVSKISRYFSKEVDTKRYPVVGNYDLTITNTDGISYFYDGSLNNNYTIDGDNISEYIRKALNLPQLFVFEDHGLKRNINTLEVNVFKNDEKIFIDRNKANLSYEYKGNTICLNSNNKIIEFLDKYNERLTNNFKFSSVIGEPWEYEVKACYSYGEELDFGGTLSKAPYFYKEMLESIKSMIQEECFGKIFVEEKSNNECCEYGVALVTGSDISYDSWFRFNGMRLQCGDIVLVNNEDDDYVIGKVTKIRKNQTRDAYGYSVYNKIIKKI